MNKEEKYRRTMDLIKGSTEQQDLSPERKAELRASILSRIVSDESNSTEGANRFEDQLFSWTTRPWLRMGVSMASLVLLLVFVIQQVGIKQRMKALERQMPGIELPYETGAPGLGLGHKAFLKHYGSSDSITVSRRDLDKLLEEYQDLLEKDQKEDPGTESGTLKL